MEPDRCTAWFEGWWGYCCAAHDLAYADPLIDRLTADQELAACVAGTGAIGVGIAALMYAGVRLFGGWFRRRSIPTQTQHPAPTRRLFLEANMDRRLFYAAARQQLGALTQANVVGFDLVLDEAHRRGARLHDLAYILATAWWESGRTMQPVKEAFWLSEAWRRKNLRYSPYYGRGLVQLTWEANYRKASDLYGVDFVKAPDLVMDPKHSVNILFDGMTHGWFTGKDLGDYIDAVDESDDEDLREFANARRVVNGADKQVEIGKLALAFEAALKVSGYAKADAVPIPTPRPPAPTQDHPAMPPTIGHNGGPPLTDPSRPTAPAPSPVDQSNKAVGAGKWAGLAAAIWQAVIVADVLPAPYDTTEFSTAVMGIIATVAAIVGSYRAQPNAEPAA